jgi:putative endonuclease
MRSEHLLIGSWGEAIARSYFKARGYRIIEQNYKTRYLEIDLVVRKGRVLVFVEVRTKVGDSFGLPEDTLRPKKIRKLIRNASAYAAGKGYRGDCRIDAVCILLDENKNLSRINHYQNITG